MISLKDSLTSNQIVLLKKTMILQRTLFKHVVIIFYSTIPSNKYFDLSNKRIKMKE